MKSEYWSILAVKQIVYKTEIMFKLIRYMKYYFNFNVVPKYIRTQIH
jgi:hypothetical protein